MISSRISSPSLKLRAVLCVIPAMIVCASLWWAPAKGSGIESAPQVAGHRIIRVFSKSNSPIRGFPLGFDAGKLFQDRTGKFWVTPGVGTKSIVEVYDEHNQQWTTFGDAAGTTSNLLHYREALLPHDVEHVGQSKDGRMWFADGSTNSYKRPLLTSFDGTQWQRFDFLEKSTGYVRVGFRSDTEGTLWFWSGEELRNYDGARWSPTYRISEMFKEPVPRNAAADRETVRYEVFDAIQDRDKLWWFALVSGIVRYDKIRNVWKRFPQIEPNRQIYEDRSGRLWFADTDLVSVYDKSKDSVRSFRLSDHLTTEHCGYSLPTLRCMYQDKRGQMLFGHGCGLICYSETTSKWELIHFNRIGLKDSDDESNAVNDIMEDRQGRIWISCSTAILVLEP